MIQIVKDLSEEFLLRIFNLRIELSCYPHRCQRCKKYCGRSV